MFVTSDTSLPSSFNADLSGADAHCDALAAAAGLNHQDSTTTHFKAFLSTSTTAAPARLTGYRGWIRVDGREFADDLVSDPKTIFYPPRIAETGASVSGNVITGTTQQGAIVVGGSCTSGSGNAYAGISTAGNNMWMGWEGFVNGCTNNWKLYCFETAFNTATTPPTPPANARYAFLSSGFTPSGGRAGADAHCVADGGAGVIAWIADSSATASSFLSATGGPWYRKDGVLLAATNDDFLSNKLLAPIITDSSGTPVEDFVYTWVGAGTPNLLANTALDCTDWSVTSGSGYWGFAEDLTEDWGFSSGSCSNSYRVYCVQP
jgi:hypothetical protein